MTIKSRLTHYLLKDPAKRWHWLLLALLFKGLPFLILLYNRPLCNIPGFWGGSMGDTPSYLDPIDKLLSFGSYSPDFRMPGYGAVYFVFHLFTSKAIACNLIIITQLLPTIASTYYLKCLSSNVYLFENKQTRFKMFASTLFLLSTYSNFL